MCALPGVSGGRDLLQVRQRPLAHVAAQPVVRRRVCRCGASRLSRRRCRKCWQRARGYASRWPFSRTRGLPPLRLWDCARGRRSRRDAVFAAARSSWRGNSLLLLDGLLERGQPADGRQMLSKMTRWQV